jgi:hypothetical protein
MPIASLRRQFPNLMLRVMRAMRLMQINETTWRLRYIRLYCAVRIMEPAYGLAFGARPIRHCSMMMQELIHDYYHAEVATGVSERLETRCGELQRKLQQHCARVA